MAQPTIINKFGTLTGWNSFTWNWFGRDVEGILSAEYSDKVEWKNENGANKYPIGQSEGNYTASASIEIYDEELQAMLRALPAGVRLQDVVTTAIAVYETDADIKKDIIHNVRIMNVGKTLKQGDGKMTVKLDILISHITWNA